MTDESESSEWGGGEFVVSDGNISWVSRGGDEGEDIQKLVCGMG